MQATSCDTEQRKFIPSVVRYPRLSCPIMTPRVFDFICACCGVKAGATLTSRPWPPICSMLPECSCTRQTRFRDEGNAQGSHLHTNPGILSNTHRAGGALAQCIPTLDRLLARSTLEVIPPQGQPLLPFKGFLVRSQIYTSRSASCASHMRLIEYGGDLV